MDALYTARTKAGTSNKKKKIRTRDLLSKDANDDLQAKVANILGEDELGLIFSRSWIRTEDLLNFRLVNKSWRDAATTTLLQRDACYVDLVLITLYDNNLDEYCVCKLKGVGNSVTRKELSQLTDLISKSPKFPTSTFYIHSSRNHLERYTDYPDLLRFFKLHGKKIKSFYLVGQISRKVLLDILWMYAPNLECIDFKYAEFVQLAKEGDCKLSDLNGVLKPFALQSVTFDSIWLNPYDSDSENATIREIIHLLLSSSPKLSRIENVTLDTLSNILSEGKGHLIRSFKYEYFHTKTSDFNALILKFLDISPKITSVTLDMDLSCPTDTPLFSDFIDILKETIQNLELCFSYNSSIWEPQLKIPPMKNLKSIKLNGFYEAGDNLRGIDELRAMVFKFQDNISAEQYFPELSKVLLNPRGELLTEAYLMGFFKFNLGQNSTAWDCFPKVDSLEIEQDERFDTTSLHSDKRAAPTLSVAIFPNIRILKIQCGEIINLGSSLWAMCPKVEFLEIYDISNYKSFKTNVEKVELSLLVDKFFTGFPLGLCRKFRTTELPKEMDNPVAIKFMRVTPSVCDLRNLKELKLKFSGKVFTEFASRVTGNYAFAKMPNTKFIISYNPSKFGRYEALDDWEDNSDDDDDDLGDENEDGHAEKVCFGSIKPFVHIVHDKD